MPRQHSGRESSKTRPKVGIGLHEFPRLAISKPPPVCDIKVRHPSGRRRSVPSRPAPTRRPGMPGRSPGGIVTTELLKSEDDRGRLPDGELARLRALWLRVVASAVA